MLPSSAMVILSKEYEGTEDLTWIWIFHFQEEDSQHSPWRSICPPCPLFLQLKFSKPSPPSQPFLQSTSCNKAQIKRLAMFAFCLVYFFFFRSIFILHCNVLEVNYGEQVSGWTVFSPKGRHTSLRLTMTMMKFMLVMTTMKMMVLIIKRSKLHSLVTVRVKTKSQIKTSDYLNLYDMDFTLGPIQISL